MIIGKGEINNLLDTDKISIISATYDQKDNRIITSKIKATDDHKIQLTIGFLLKTFSKTRWIHPDHYFSKNNGIVDLRTFTNSTLHTTKCCLLCI